LKIVPILLQEHYRPDGWLLFLIGQLLYVDFTKFGFSRAMNMLLNELKAEEIFEINATPVRSRADTVSAVCNEQTEVTVNLLPASVLPKNIQDWTKKNVYDWLIEHDLIQMSQLLTNCDGRGLLYLNDFIKNGETKQVLNLLQEESLRRNNESLSLVEVSYLRSLIDQQKCIYKSKSIRLSTRRITNRQNKYFSSCCELI
jgi:hypothetical protein